MTCLLGKPLYQPDSIALSMSAGGITLMLARALGLVRNVALTWLLIKEQFGLMGVALMAINVLLPLSTAGLYEGIARYTPTFDQAGLLRPFVKRSMLLITGVSLFVFLLLNLPGQSFSDFLFAAGAWTNDHLAESTVTSSQQVNLGRAVLICLLTLAPFHATMSILRGLRMFRAYALMELSQAALFTALALIFTAASQSGAVLVVVAYTVGNIVSTLLFLPGLLGFTSQRASTPAPSSNRPIASTLITFSLWAGGTGLLWHVLSYYPMWHLLKVTDNDTVGTFTAIRLIAQVIQMVGVLLVSIVSASANQIWERDGRASADERLATLTKATMLLLIVIACCLTIAAPVILRILPASFGEGASALPGLLVFFLLVAFVLLLTIRMNLIEKPKLVMVAWIVGTIVSVFASFQFLGSPMPGDGTASPNPHLTQDPLTAAAYVGVIGVSAAAIVLLGLLATQRFLPHRGTILLGLCCAGLLLPTWLIIILLLTMTVVSFRSDWLFTANERFALWQVVRARS